MGELWNRTFALNLGGTLVASETKDGAKNEMLKVEFKVERSLTPPPTQPRSAFTT